MPDIHNYLLQYLQILWGSLFFPQFLHTINEANSTLLEALRFPTRWVECFRFGSGVIVEDNYNRLYLGQSSDFRNPAAWASFSVQNHRSVVPGFTVIRS